MLRAYLSMPAEEFIAQLRVYVIAMGLSPQVIEAVDNLIGLKELEHSNEIEVEDAEERGEKRGRTSMKKEMIDDVTKWLEGKPDPEGVLDLLKEIEL